MLKTTKTGSKNNEMKNKYTLKHTNKSQSNQIISGSRGLSGFREWSLKNEAFPARHFCYCNHIQWELVHPSIKPCTQLPASQSPLIRKTDFESNRAGGLYLSVKLSKTLMQGTVQKAGRAALSMVLSGSQNHRTHPGKVALFLFFVVSFFSRTEEEET